MAAIPLSLAVPAATASLAYLNAKLGIGADLRLITSSVVSAKNIERVEAAGRVNMFYNLEDQAHATTQKDRPFIGTPPAIPKGARTPQDLVGLRTVEYTYEEVYKTVLQYAAWLKQTHNVQTGEIVALNCTNKVQFVYLWFAIMSLGATAALINTGLRGEAMLHCVKTSTARLLVLDPELQDCLPETQEGLANAGITIALVDSPVESQIRSMVGYRAPDSDRSGAKANDMAVLIFTSGTTGLPKAAVVPWKKFQGVKALAMWIGVKKTDRYYSAMPLYHSAGSILGLIMTLHVGACFIISSHFSPRTFFASVTASDATMMQYIGEMCRYLVSAPPSNFDKSHKVRFAFGNGLRPDVYVAFKERFNITEIGEIYSATETVNSTFVKSKNYFNMGAVGRAGALLRLMFRNENVIIKHDVETAEPWKDPKTGLCERVQTGESGELLNAVDPLNLSDKYAGYFGNEKASNSKILRDVLKKGDAWYRTGDLLKQDSEGRLYFIDRIGDTFRWKSENVSTNEVAELLTLSPHVSEVNVYGVALPNHDGRAGCAALILRDPPATEQVLAELAQHARAKLPRYAVPIFLRVVGQFEVTGTSKYQKSGLRAQGVDPGLTGEDAVFWLPPNATAYQRFGKKEWESIVGGGVKL